MLATDKWRDVPYQPGTICFAFKLVEKLIKNFRSQARVDPSECGRLQKFYFEFLIKHFYETYKEGVQKNLNRIPNLTTNSRQGWKSTLAYQTE